MHKNINFYFIFSGYDFGYLLKILTNNSLPAEENEFFDLIKIFFRNIYDVKYLMKSCKNLKVSFVRGRMLVRPKGFQFTAFCIKGRSARSSSTVGN